MPVTKVGVVYSSAQLVRRRIIKSDSDDADIDIHKATMLPGEAWLEIPLNVYNKFGNTPKDHVTGNTLDVHIASILGNPKNDVCVIVSPDGNIVGYCHADPSIDSHPAGTLQVVSP